MVQDFMERREYCCYSSWEKVLLLYLPYNLILRSNSGEISVPLVVHNPSLHLRNSSLLNNHFLDTLSSSSYSFNSFTHLLSSSPHVSSTFNFVPIIPSNLYNIFKRIRLTSAGPFDLSGRMLLLCLPQCFLLYMLNFSLSLLLENSIVLPFPKFKINNPSSASSFRPISLLPLPFSSQSCLSVFAFHNLMSLS